MLAFVITLSVKSYFMEAVNSEPDGILYREVSGKVFFMKDGIVLNGALIQFLNISENVQLIPGEKARATFSVFKGNNPSLWKKSLPLYRSLIYRNLYPGIDLQVKGLTDGNVELQWIVNPGADPDRIRFAIKGEARILDDGSLAIGNAIMEKPRAFQGTREIEVKYISTNNNVFSIQVKNHDPRFTLVIDPSIVIGGSGSANIKGVEVRHTGGDYVYLLLEIDASTLADPKGYESSATGGKDIAILKINATLDDVVSGAILGGSMDDWALAMDVDEYVYVLGGTYSDDIPMINSYDDTYHGNGDIFVAKLDTTLNDLIASTYVGGSGEDGVLDRNHKNGKIMYLYDNKTVYFTTTTSSSDIPTPNGFDNTLNSFGVDIYVGQLSRNLDTLKAATYLGGDGTEIATGLYADGYEGIYVVGGVQKTEGGQIQFPVSDSAYDTSFASAASDEYEGFIARLSLNLDTLRHSTYFGGSDFDYIHQVYVEYYGIYIVGSTRSADLPIGSSGLDSTFNGGEDGFVVRLTYELDSLYAGSFIGGSGDDKLVDLYYDLVFPPKSHDLYERNYVYVLGVTNSSSISNVSCSNSPSGGKDLIVLKFPYELTGLEACTFVGGSKDEEGYSLYVDPGGDYTMRGLYVTGYTESSDFPTLSPAYDSTYMGQYDAFVVRLDSNLTITASTLLDQAFEHGGGDEKGYDIVSTSSGIYAVGNTSSPDFPYVSGTYDSTHNGRTDIVIMKLSSDLELTQATFLGGSEDDNAYAIGYYSGYIYVAGETESSDFPTTSGAYSTSLKGSKDIFVSRLPEDLSDLDASTLIGGSETSDTSEQLGSMVITSDGVFLTGMTRSSDFPIENGYDNTLNGTRDMFVARLTHDLQDLTASTFLGGDGDDAGYSLAVTDNAVYVGGSADNFTYSGGFDQDETHSGFIARFSLGLDQLQGGTHVYGIPYGLAASGDTIYALTSLNQDIPDTGNYAAMSNGYSSTRTGDYDFVVYKISGDLGTLISGTYLGGGSAETFARTDRGTRIEPVSDGIYFAGVTLSNDFPVQSNAFDSDYNGGRDGIVVKLTRDLDDLLYSTYVGGSTDDNIANLEVTSSRVYVIGSTLSSDYPVTVEDSSLIRAGSDIAITSFNLSLTPVDKDETLNSTIAFLPESRTLKLTIPSTAYVGLDLYNIAGRLMDRISVGVVNAGTVEIPLEKYATGVYILKIRIGDEILRKKVILY